MVSLALIFYGTEQSHYYQMAGLLLMPIALGFAIYGDIGIFANRFSQFISKADERAKNRDIF